MIEPILALAIKIADAKDLLYTNNFVIRLIDAANVAQCVEPKMTPCPTMTRGSEGAKAVIMAPAAPKTPDARNTVHAPYLSIIHPKKGPGEQHHYVYCLLNYAKNVKGAISGFAKSPSLIYLLIKWLVLLFS